MLPLLFDGTEFKDIDDDDDEVADAAAAAAEDVECDVLSSGFWADEVAVVTISGCWTISCMVCVKSVPSSASFGFTFNCGRTTPKYQFTGDNNNNKRERERSHKNI